MVLRLENAAKRNAAQASRDHGLGMEPGAPDLVVLFHTAVVWLEMKKAKGGKVSPAQADAHARLQARGQTVIVAHGHEEAIAALEDYAHRNTCRNCARYLESGGCCGRACADAHGERP